MPFSPGQFYHNPDRAVAKGDVAALMSQAGYGIHPHDKPPFPAHTPSPSLPDSPIWLLDNRRTHRYQSTDVPNDTAYCRRTTPVGCYYDSTEIKRFVASQRIMEMPGIGNSRICGMALTTDYLFRILYSTEKVFLLKNTGEENIISNLRHLFTGYLPPNKHAILLVGDRQCKTALRLLENSNRKYLTPQQAGRVQNNQLLNTWNAGSPLFYLTLSRSSLSMLRIMQYPGWEAVIRRMAAQMVFRNVEPLRGDGRYHFRGDGVLCFIGIDLNLSQLSHMLLENDTRDAVVLVCLEWQVPFFQEVLKQFDPYCRLHVEVKTLPDSFLLRVENELAARWEVDLMGNG
jgi:hypothetical protein